jgi:hypothetical protein
VGSSLLALLLLAMVQVLRVMSTRKKQRLVDLSIARYGWC